MFLFMCHRCYEIIIIIKIEIEWFLYDLEEWFRLVFVSGGGRSLFVLSANYGRKDQNMASSFSHQRKSQYGEGIVRLANRVALWHQSEVSVDFYKVLWAWSFFTWAFAYPTKSHVRLYPFNEPIKSFYFCSFAVSVLVVHFHFKVIKKSLLGQNVQQLKWNHELQASGTRFINLTWSSGDSGYTHYTW